MPHLNKLKQSNKYRAYMYKNGSYLMSIKYTYCISMMLTLFFMKLLTTSYIPDNPISLQMFTSITSVFLGFILRLALDYRDGKLTWKLFITQTIFSIDLSYVAYLVRRDYKFNISLDLLLILISFFAPFIVSLFDKFGKFGIKNAFIIFFRRYTAETELNNEKPENNERTDKLA